MTVTGETTLTKGQAERRQRVVDAALTLAARGGYEAVQMRDVAAEADVALGTIYRYFSSKDHLLAAAQLIWIEELERRVSQRPPQAETIADRVVAILRRATSGLERSPQLSEALVVAMSSGDRNAAMLQYEVSVRIMELLKHAFPDTFDQTTRDDIVRCLGHIWFSSLVAWVNGGWADGPVDIGEELETGARLLLAPFEG